MITAVFTDNSDYARATGLWQWDYGQRLRIEGLKLPTAIEIHFALTEFAGDAIPRVGTTKDGVTEVVIPDSLLENQAAGTTYEIYAWIYLADKTSGETIKRICLQVKCRPKPEAFDAPGDAEIFHDAIAQVNASADRAETAREGAEVAKKAAEAAAGKIEGEIAGAGQIAEQVKQNAAAVAKDKQAVSQMVTETTQNAQKAAESAQAAERSSTAAKEAQKAAETAKTGATAAMEEVERDRTEVSNTHRLVEQMRDAVSLDKQAVASDRQAVEQTATQFEQTAQNALTAVGQAQKSAVGAVSAEGKKQTTAVTTEGEKQVTAVQRAGTQAVSDVAEAKTEAVQAVTTEGDTQTKRVQDAAAGIAADREQIAANKQAIEGKVDKQQGADNAGKALVVGKDGNVELGDAQTKTDPTLTESGQAADAQVTGREIATLHQGKADAIVETAQGETMTLTDSSDKLFEGLRVFGKSTQGGVPSVENPVSIVNVGESGSITVEVTGRNLLPLTEDNIVKNTPLKVVINEDGSLSISGTPSKRYESVFSIQLMNLHPGIYYLGGGTYTKGELIVQLNIVRNNDSVEYISNKSFELKPDDKKRVLSIQYSSAELVQVNQTIYPILVHGTESVPFEPYRKPQSLTLSTPNGLPGIPVSKDGNYTDQNGQQWICDEVDLTRGKYVQRVLKTKPNKTIVFNNRNENGRCALFDNSLFGTKWMNGTKQALSSIAQWSEWGNGADGTFALSIVEIYYKDSMKTLEEVNAMFAKLGTNIEICGVLDTPIERDLTPEELTAYKALHTNYPTTVITNDAGAHMEVSYVADTGTYIRNMEERLNAKLLNIQSALISQKISVGGIKVTDSAELPIQNLRIFGKSTQDGVPTPEKPIPIISVGDNGNIALSVNEQKLTLFTPNGLPGIKVKTDGNYTDSTGQQWICDEVDCDRGIYIQRIAVKNKDELNFIDNGLCNGGTLHGYAIKIDLYDEGTYQKRTFNVLCNKFVQGNGVNCVNMFTVGDSGWGGWARATFKVPIEYDNLDKFKLLIGDDFVFMCPLKDVVEYNLTPEEITMFKKTHMAHPSTTISNDENAEMELTYTVDTKSYIDRKIAEISSAIVKGV